jgi:tRNA (guanine37-N1)-methyltransferase
MIFDIMTLFPEMVKMVLDESVIGRAQKSGAIEINYHNIRDFSKDKHRRVDDTPYGGGKGMLMMAPPIYDCYEHITSTHSQELKKRVIYMSPRGTVFNQKKRKSFQNMIT